MRPLSLFLDVVRCLRDDKTAWILDSEIATLNIVVAGGGTILLMVTTEDGKIASLVAEGPNKAEEKYSDDLFN